MQIKMQIKKEYQNITSDRRNYFLDGISYPRVSTILGNIDKSALIKWAVRLACEKFDTMLDEKLAIANMGYQFDTQFKKDVIELAKTEHVRQMTEAQDYGSFVHDKIECWLKKCKEPNNKYPKEWIVPANKSLKSFIDFWNEGKFELIKSEMAVINKELGYGGRIDILAKQGDTALILDIKTGKSVWKSAKIQCALYSMALQEMWGGMLNNIDTTLFSYPKKAIIAHIPKLTQKVKPIFLEGEGFKNAKKAGLDLVNLYYNLKGVK